MYEVFSRFIHNHKDQKLRDALRDRSKAEEMLKWLRCQPDFPGKEAHVDAMTTWLEKSERKIYEKLGL